MRSLWKHGVSVAVRAGLTEVEVASSRYALVVEIDFNFAVLQTVDATTALKR